MAAFEPQVFSTPGRISISPADLLLSGPPLATANISYDDLRFRTSNFLAQFDAFISEEKQQITERRQRWLNAIGEDREKYAKLQKEFEQYTSQGYQLARTLEREKQEVNDAQIAINDLSRQRDIVQERKENLQAEVNSLKADIKKRRELKNASKRAMEEQRTKNDPELRVFEDKMAFQIVGAKEDALSFIWSHVSESDASREFLITVDVSERSYKVLQCDPILPTLDKLLDQLNKSRDFYRFLKLVRKGFKDLIASEK